MLWKHDDCTTGDDRGAALAAPRGLVDRAPSATTSTASTGTSTRTARSSSRCKLTGILHTTAVPSPATASPHATRGRARRWPRRTTSTSSAPGSTSTSTAPSNTRRRGARRSAIPAGPENPHGNAFRAASRRCSRSERRGAAHRRSPLGRAALAGREPGASRNRLGEPVGYKLVPGDDVAPCAAARLAVRARAPASSTRHLWVDAVRAATSATRPATTRTSTPAATACRAGRRPTARSTATTSCSGTTFGAHHVAAPRGLAGHAGGAHAGSGCARSASSTATRRSTCRRRQRRTARTTGRRRRRRLRPGPGGAGARPRAPPRQCSRNAVDHARARARPQRRQAEPPSGGDRPAIGTLASGPAVRRRRRPPAARWRSCSRSRWRPGCARARAGASGGRCSASGRPREEAGEVLARQRQVEQHVRAAAPARPARPRAGRPARRRRPAGRRAAARRARGTRRRRRAPRSYVSTAARRPCASPSTSSSWPPSTSAHARVGDSASRTSGRATGRQRRDADEAAEVERPRDAARELGAEPLQRPRALQQRPRVAQEAPAGGRGTTPRPRWRTSSRVPSRRSRSATVAETVDWARCSRSAAL